MKGKNQMCHKLFSQQLIACVMAVALSVATAQATIISLDPNNSNEFVTLADLLPGGNTMGVSVSDKTFTEFFYSTIGDDMPEPELIRVFGFQDQDGHVGVRFHGVFRDRPGGNISDALLEFTVNVSDDAAAQGYRISDAHLYVDGIGLGEDSEFFVDESFQENNYTLNAGGTTLGGQLDTTLSDWVFFDERYTSLRVTKDIFADAGDTNQSARVSSIAQTFSQEIVPEPATLCMAALAILGMAVSRRNS